MLQHLRAFLHAIADNLLDCYQQCVLHKLLHSTANKTRHRSEPKLEIKRAVPRDTSRLTDAQIIALVRTWQEAQTFNATRRKGDPPRITQEDLTVWANETFGKNKSRKTYMKIINQFLKESNAHERPYTIGIQSNTRTSGRHSDGQNTKQQSSVLSHPDSIPVRKSSQHDASFSEATGKRNHTD